MIITGYRIHSTDLMDIEMEMNKVRASLKRITKRAYHTLLGEEVAFLADCVALNILKRNAGQSIYEAALDNLNGQVQKAEALSAPTKFNLSAYAQIMQMEGLTYVKVLAPNCRLHKAFSWLEPYSLTEAECRDEKNAKTITWKKLHDIYEKSEPISIRLTQTVDPAPEKLTYPSKKDRCETLARHNVMNHFLNIIAGGNQIPPALHMRYMDYAFEMLDTEEGISEIKRKTAELATILLDLSADDSVVFEKYEKTEDK